MVACLCCIIPFSRQLIIIFIQTLMGRQLRNVHKWDDILVHSMFFFFFIQTFWFFFAYTAKGKEIWTEVSETVKKAFTQVYTKKYLLALLIIFLVSYWAIIRANYEYADDARRVFAGHKAWVGWSRYVSETLAVIFHTNFFINDISPVGQFIAIAIIVVFSYILAYVAMDGKVTKLSLAAASLAGLCPFFVTNFSYKFDCPYMALAMLFGILPFLFVSNTVVYCVMSFISLLLVCTSYQAANSLYILLALFTAYKMWSSKKAWKNIGIFSLASVLCYIAALVFFRLFLMNTWEGDSVYRGTGIAIGGGMFSVMAANFKEYWSVIGYSYGNIWIKVFTAVSVILFPFAAAKRTSRNKFAAAGMSLVLLLLMAVLSFGAYLVLEQALISSRTFMGFDLLIALIALFDCYGADCSVSFKKFNGAVTICLLYGFCIFATVTGSMYAKQKDYENFRFSILLQDLSHIVNPQAQNSIYIAGITGPAGKTRMEKENYNLNTGTLSPVLTKYLVLDWNMQFEFLSEDNLDELDLRPDVKKKLTGLPLIEDTYYHTIYGKDNQYYVYLKNPKVTN
jgi:hypothetical protein